MTDEGRGGEGRGGEGREGKVFLRWREIEKNGGLSRLYKLVLSEMVVLIWSL